MSSRRLVPALAALLLLGSGVTGLLTPTAGATQAPVAFTSVALPTWQTNGIAWSTASADGLVFVGGTFSAVRPPGGSAQTRRNDLVVLDAATGAPVACAPAVAGSHPTVRALAVSPDSRTLYVGGMFSSVAGQARNQLAAIDIASCTVIGSFRPAVSGTVRSIAATDTAVYITGDVTRVNGTARAFAAAVTAVGTGAPGATLPFAPALDNVGRAIALKPDGRQLVLGGDFVTVNGRGSVSVAVVDPSTGALVHAFPAGFFPTDHSVVKDVVVDNGGFYLANEGTGLGKFDGRVAVDWTDFTRRWTDRCLGATQALVVYHGLLYSGSHAHDCSTMGWWPDGARHHFLAESVKAADIQAWFPQTNDGLGEGLGPRDMVVATSGGSDYLWSVGEFTTVDGRAQQGMTRFGQGPDQAAPGAPVLSLTSFRPGQVHVAWQPSVDTDDMTLTYRVYRDGDPTPVLTTTRTAPFWARQQIDLDDAGLTPGTTHSYRVTATDGTSTTTSATRSVAVTRSSSAYAERVLADGAVSLLRYDESSDTFLDDATGQCHSMVIQGSAQRRVSGALAHDASTALTLTGAGSYVTSSIRTDALSAFTEETWFKTTSRDGGVLMSFGEKQLLLSRHPDKQVFMTSAGRLAFGVVNGSTPTVITSGATYDDGTWHHVAATQGPAGMSLYVDGVRVAHGSRTTSLTTPGYWRVGQDEDAIFPGHPTSTFFQGTLDETAVYASALSADTIAAHVATAGSPVPPPPPPPPPPPGSVTLTPTADTFANEGAPAAVYGRSSVLTTRVSPNAAVSYLRFVLPAAPSGTTLTEARLTFRTTTDRTSSSSAPVTVALADDAWSEATLTWAHRPAVTSSPLGSLSAAPAASTSYAVTLSTAGLQALLGQQVSIAVSGSSADGLAFWSREFGMASARPHLELTFA